MLYGDRRRSMRVGDVLLAAGLLWISSALSIARADDVAPSAVYGIWASSGTMVEVTAREEGGLSAKIISLKHPHWREKDSAGEVGVPKTDVHNPDETLRSRPFIGLEMLEDYEFRNGKWQGRLYLPSNGSTWKSSATVKNGELRIRGYIGVSLFGKTQKFAPIASCNEDILRMIRTADLKDTPCADKLENEE